MPATAAAATTTTCSKATKLATEAANDEPKTRPQPVFFLSFVVFLSQFCCFYRLGFLLFSVFCFELLSLVLLRFALSLSFFLFCYKCSSNGMLCLPVCMCVCAAFFNTATHTVVVFTVFCCGATIGNYFMCVCVGFVNKTWELA